jgi:hypothetical protein
MFLFLPQIGLRLSSLGFQYDHHLLLMDFHLRFDFFQVGFHLFLASQEAFQHLSPLVSVRLNHSYPSQLIWSVQFNPTSDISCHMYVVTIDGVWIDNWIGHHLQSMKRARVMVDLYRSWPLAVDPPRRS